MNSSSTSSISSTSSSSTSSIPSTSSTINKRSSSAVQDDPQASSKKPKSQVHQEAQHPTAMNLDTLSGLNYDSIVEQFALRRPNADAKNAEDLILLTLGTSNGRQFMGTFPRRDLPWTSEEMIELHNDKYASVVSRWVKYMTDNFALYLQPPQGAIVHVGQLYSFGRHCKPLQLDLRGVTEGWTLYQ